MKKTILVTGATGNIGMLVIPKLIGAGATVHAFVRNAEKAKPLEDAGAKIFVGDFEDPKALDNAMIGVDTVFSITPPNPRSVEQASETMNAAKRAENPPAFVRLSVVNAALDAPTENARLHGVTEKELKESGLRFTILQPHFFMQNIWGSVQTIAEQGKMYWGMGNGKLGMIDVRDIVDASVEVLLNRSFGNKTWKITGPVAITFHEAASAIALAIGKPVNYIPVDLETVRNGMKQLGFDEWFADVMAQYSKAYSEGWGDFTTGDFAELTGKPARNISQFATEVLATSFMKAATAV